MSERHVKEDKVLKLTQLSDPDNCEGTMYIDINQGVDWICIQVSSLTSDTREYGSGNIFLEKQQIEELYKFLGEHLRLLNL